MNILDTILLANLSVSCLLLSSEYFNTQAIQVYILLLLPIVLLTLFATTKMVHNKLLKKVNLKQKVMVLFHRNTHQIRSVEGEMNTPNENDCTPLLI